MLLPVTKWLEPLGPPLLFSELPSTVLEGGSRSINSIDTNCSSSRLTRILQKIATQTAFSDELYVPREVRRLCSLLDFGTLEVIASPPLRLLDGNLLNAAVIAAETAAARAAGSAIVVHS